MLNGQKKYRKITALSVAKSMKFSLQKSIKTYNNINDDSVTLSLVPPFSPSLFLPHYVYSLMSLISARDSKQNKTKTQQKRLYSLSLIDDRTTPRLHINSENKCIHDLRT